MKTYRDMSRVLVLSIFAFALDGTVFASARARDVSPSLMYAQRHARLTYVNQRSRDFHAEAELRLHRTATGETPRYILQVKGEGRFDRFHDVVFEKTAVLEERDDGVWPVETEVVVRDRRRQVMAVFRKDFDQQTGQIRFSESDGEGLVVNQQDYQVDGPVCDDVTLVCFLKARLHKGDPPLRSFALVTNEPKLYRVNIRKRGEEVLEFPMGQRTASKYQLLGDLGPLTALAAKFVPPTYVWYDSTYPHDWLQYQGMEVGPQSAYVRIFVSGVAEHDANNNP